MWFTKVFYQHIMFRHSCGNCHYCNTTRPSDITIADFWGWEKTGSELNKDDKGINLILVNTEKGKRLFDLIKGDIEIFEAKPEAYLQPNLQHPSIIHRLRDKFEEDYKTYGFEYVYMHKYHEKSLWQRIIRKIKRLINHIVKI